MIVLSFLSELYLRFWSLTTFGAPGYRDYGFITFVWRAVACPCGTFLPLVSNQSKLLSMVVFSYASMFSGFGALCDMVI